MDRTMYNHIALRVNKVISSTLIPYMNQTGNKDSKFTFMCSLFLSWHMKCLLEDQRLFP